MMRIITSESILISIVFCHKFANAQKTMPLPHSVLTLDPIFIHSVLNSAFLLVSYHDYSIPCKNIFATLRLMIYEPDPQPRPVVITIFTRSVRTSFLAFHNHKISKQI